MGTVDRFIRIMIAIVLAVLYYNGTITGTWGMVALVAAAVFVLTSLVSFCPIYGPLGINTCPAEKKKA